MSPIFGKVLLGATAAAVILIAAGCGGGGINSTAFTAPEAGADVSSPMLGQANVVRVYVDGGPSRGRNAANAIYADVVICAPGSTGNCATIDHMRVDTGSAGVRVFASALPTTLLAALPQQSADTGKIAGECLAYVSGTTWGGVRRADVYLGGSPGAVATASNAPNIPIQVIHDPDFRLSVQPSTCTGQGATFTSVEDFSGKGVLGIGIQQRDCGYGCERFKQPIYYSCPASGSCIASTMPQVDQVVNPIVMLAEHDNGSSIVLPALDGPARGAEGMLILGIGTAKNNGMLAQAQALAIDGAGYFSSSFNGNVLKYSYIDSGSAVNYLPDHGAVKFPSCSRYPMFLCPSPEVSMTAENTGLGNTKTTANVFVGHADEALTYYPGYSAIPGLASSTLGSSTIDLGASFFFGRQIYTLVQDKSASGFATKGPAFAHTP
jgi:hypothetical protein